MAKAALEETSEVGLTGKPVRGRQHSHPACILHVDGHVQSQHTLKSFAVYLHSDEVPPTHHRGYRIAGDEADREKDQDAQYEQGGDYKQ